VLVETPAQPHPKHTGIPHALNAAAWAIVDPESSIEDRRLDLAMGAALLANKLTRNRDAAMIDTLARCHAWSGNYKKALSLQKRAVRLAPDNNKSTYQSTLREYKRDLKANR